MNIQSVSINQSFKAVTTGKLKAGRSSSEIQAINRQIIDEISQESGLPKKWILAVDKGDKVTFKLKGCVPEEHPDQKLFNNTASRILHEYGF